MYWATQNDPIFNSAFKKNFEVYNPIKMIAMITLEGVHGDFTSIHHLLLELLELLEPSTKPLRSNFNLQL